MLLLRLIPLFLCCLCFSSNTCDGLPLLCLPDCARSLSSFLACSFLQVRSCPESDPPQEQSNVLFALFSQLKHCSVLSPAFRSASCRNPWDMADFAVLLPCPKGAGGAGGGEKCVPLVTHAAFCWLAPSGSTEQFVSLCCLGCFEAHSGKTPL